MKIFLRRSLKAIPGARPMSTHGAHAALRAAALSVGTLLLMSAVGACSGMSNRSENTAVGAGAGAVAGAVLTGGSAVGTVGGAVVGGVIGNGVEKKK